MSRSHALIINAVSIAVRMVQPSASNGFPTHPGKVFLSRSHALIINAVSIAVRMVH